MKLPARYVRSLVIPATSATIAPPDWLAQRRFTSADLPTLGRPITAMTGLPGELRWRRGLEKVEEEATGAYTHEGEQRGNTHV